MGTLAFLLPTLCRFITDIDTFPGVDCYIRHGRGIRDKQSTDAVVVDGQFLYPFAIDFLGLVNLNVINQFVQHPGRQLLGTGVLAVFNRFIEN